MPNLESMRALSLLLAGPALANFMCDNSTYGVLTLSADNNHTLRDTRILYPKAPGAYPVFTFLHGFMMRDLTVYDEILCDSAKDTIIVIMQMSFRVVREGLKPSSEILKPYLFNETVGVLPRIGSQILPGYSYTFVGVGGHSRGGGVLAYGYSHSILSDNDFTGMALIDPVILLESDVAGNVTLSKTKVRTLFFRKGKCVTHGWAEFGPQFSGCADLQVANASQCDHMDVVDIASFPMCTTDHGDEFKALARQDIAAAGFGPAVIQDLLTV